MWIGFPAATRDELIKFAAVHSENDSDTGIGGPQGFRLHTG